jgi:uncharacterized protein YeaO (DUF488 family)
MPIIKIKRIYYPHNKSDGYRILVDRLWPRCLKKEEAFFDEWANDLAPSEKLSDWFDKDPFFWEAFTKRYTVELSQNTQINDFVERHKERKHLTLLYATTYDKLTHAIVLKEFLDVRFCEV